MHSWSTSGLLCDLDGTLVDSAAVIEQVWTEVAQRHDLPRAQLIADLPGRTASDILARFLDDPHLIADEVSWIGHRQLRVDGIGPIPGAGRLLDAVPPDRWAVVTAAPEAVARARLSAAGLPQPAVLIGAESVRAGKPDPQGYLLAARRLGVPGYDCVVLEDSTTGVRAGHAAGARVVGIGTEQVGADVTVSDLRALVDVHSSGKEIRWTINRTSLQR